MPVSTPVYPSWRPQLFNANFSEIIPFFYFLRLLLPPLMPPASTPHSLSSSSRTSSPPKQSAVPSDQHALLSQSPPTVAYSSIPSRLRAGISRSYTAPHGGEHRRARAERNETHPADYSEDEGAIQGFAEEVTAEDGPEVAGMPRSATMLWLKSYGDRSQKSV